MKAPLCQILKVFSAGKVLGFVSNIRLMAVARTLYVCGGFIWWNSRPSFNGKNKYPQT